MWILVRNYNEIIETVNYLIEKDIQLMITISPMINEVIGNLLRNKFMKDLIVQILSMVSEQERNKSNPFNEAGKVVQLAVYSVPYRAGQ